MPVRNTRRRRRAVVEEVIEKPEMKMEEPPQYTQTRQEVAAYDEPPKQAEPIKIPPPPSLQVARALIDEIPQSQGDAEKKPRLKFLFVITIFTALVVGFIAGGVYVYMSGVSQKDLVIKTSSIPSPTETPVPTSTPQPVKLSSLSVNVLNGSGIIGAASKVRAALEAGGFTVAGTGNAGSYNFSKTTIQVKSGTSTEVLEAVKNALRDYQVQVGDELSASSKFDIVVTAGKN